MSENKLLSTIIATLFSFSILWAIWVTTQIFDANSYKVLAQNTEKNVSKSVEEIKTDIKEFKKDVKQDLQKMNEEANRKQEEMIRLLIEIKKNTKNTR